MPSVKNYWKKIKLNESGKSHTNECPCGSGVQYPEHILQNFPTHTLAVLQWVGILEREFYTGKLGNSLSKLSNTYARTHTYTDDEWGSRV